MDKRLFIAFIVSIAIALGYNIFFIKPYTAKQQDQKTVQSEANQAQITASVEKTNDSAVKQTATPNTVKQQPLPQTPSPSVNTAKEVKPLAWAEDAAETEIIIENNLIKATFSNMGASLKKLSVKESKRGAFDFILPKNHTVQPMYISIPPADGVVENALFQPEQLSPSEIKFTRQHRDFVEEKIVTLKENSFQFDISYTITSNNKVTFDKGIAYSLGIVEKSPYSAKDSKASSFFGGSGAEILESVIYVDEDKGKVVSQDLKSKKLTNVDGKIIWGAVKDKYYSIITKPDMKFSSLEHQKYDGDYNTSTYMRSPSLTVEPSKSLKINFMVFAGPQTLKNLSPYKSDFEKSMYFNGFLAPVNLLLIKSLNGIYSVCKSYGWAIILITILIKLLFYPLTHASFKSMRKMQDLQPKLAVLKEAHKDNPQKLQQETMALYKREKVNPMGGCLPMIIQIPIFFSLYKVLSSAYELTDANFWWMQSLALPDNFYTLDIGGTVIPIHLLPIIMGVTMVIQQKMTTVDPQQQKAMMLMPILFTFLLYSLPSGLVLYWTLSNLLSIIQQKYVNSTKPKTNMVVIPKK